MPSEPDETRVDETADDVSVVEPRVSPVTDERADERAAEQAAETPEPTDEATPEDEPDDEAEPVPSEAELEATAAPATVRPAPKFSAFITFGALGGMVVGLLLAVIIHPSPRDSSPTGPGFISFLDGEGAVRTVMVVAGAVLGGFVGGALARAGRPARRLRAPPPTLIREPDAALVGHQDLCDDRTRGPPRRRTSEPRPPPQRKRPPGRLRRLRRLGAWRRSRQAHLLRPVRAAAPRPGVRGHRDQRRQEDPHLQRHGSRLAGLQRDRAERPARAHRRRPHAVLDDRRSSWQNAQPTLGRTAGGTVALGHNGNLTNTAELMQLVPSATGSQRAASSRAATPPTRAASPRCSPATSTTRSRRPRSRCSRGCAARSASSSWTSTRSTPRATRRASARWCSAGSSAAGSSPPRRPRSTSSARRFVREVEPGEFIAIDENGLRSQRFAPRESARGCVFEYVYLARPDTTIAGRGVHEARVEMGRRLAIEHPVEADLVIPTSRSRARPPPSATRRRVGHPVRAGPGQELLRRPHVHPAVADHPPARHPAQAEPAAKRSSRASASWSSTTRSCAATPSARSSRCCARPAPPRCTCASRARPSPGRASTASTSPRAPSSSPPAWASTRSPRRSAPTRSATSPRTA